MIISKKDHSQQPEKEKRHEALIKDICSTDHTLLAKKLEENMKWDKPTGDLVDWIKVLNMFDDIFEKQISDYGLDQPFPKLREILPDDSRILVACLKFTTMLLDHCSNGSIYSSPERIFQLINTPSIEVRIAALEVAIFLGERHSHSHSKRFNFPKATRLKILEIAKSYPPPMPAGFVQRKADNNSYSSQESNNKSVHYSLVDSIDLKKKYPSKWKLLSFQYYNSNNTDSKHTKEKKSSQPKFEEGLATFNLNEEQVRRLSFEQILDKGSECLPKESWFSFSLAALNVKAFNTKLYDSLKVRIELLKMKCIAVAITAMVCNTDYTSSNLFEPEPYILSFLVDLISPEFSSIVPAEVFYFAIKTLDCIASKRVWGTELVRHLGGNVNHGVMYQLLRHINKKIKNQDEDCYEKGHLVFFTLLSNFIESKSLVPRLASGGLLTELMSFLNIHTKYRWTCSAALNTLSMFLGPSPEWVTEFANNNGFQLLIDTINYEVDFALKNPDFGGGAPKDIVTYYKITLRQVNYLRNLLKLVTNLIQSEAGDRLRNLFDSSILVSFNKIISNPELFGPLVVSATVDSVLYIIHNEPTAFSILREANVIDTILTNYLKLFMPSHEVIMSLLEVLGAISLNKDGLAMVIESKSIKSFFGIFYDLEFAKVLVQADASTSIGCSLDELGRHYATLRPHIMTEVKSLVQNFSSYANERLKSIRLYGKGELMFYLSSDEDPDSNDDSQEGIDSWESNQSSNLFDNAISFLSGFLQDSGQWGKECVQEIPFACWENFLLLLNAPYDYVSTNSMINFLSILKYLNDEEKSYGFPHILETVGELIDSEEIRTFNSHTGKEAFFESLSNNPQRGTDILKMLHKINTVLHGVTESYLNPTIMVHERYSSFIDYLGSNPGIIALLVQLLSQCVAEEIKIRSKLPAKIVDDTAPSIEAGIDSPVLLVYSEGPNKKASVETNNSSKFKNTLQLRFLMNRLQFNIVLIVTCISRSCMQRRQDYFSVAWRRSAVDCTRSLAICLSKMWNMKQALLKSDWSSFDLIMMNIISFVSKSKDKGKEVFSTALILFFFVTTPMVKQIVDATIDTLDELLELPLPASEAKIGEPIKTTDESIKGNFVKQALHFLENLSTPSLVARLPFCSYFYNREYCDGDTVVIDGIMSQTAVQNIRLTKSYLGTKSRMFKNNDFSPFGKLGKSASNSLVAIARNTWNLEVVDEYYPLISEWIPPVEQELEHLKTKVGLSEEEAVEILQEAKSLRNIYELHEPNAAQNTQIWHKCKERLDSSDLDMFDYKPIDTGVSEEFKRDKEAEGSILFSSTMIKLAMSTKHNVHFISLALKDKKIDNPAYYELFDSIVSLSKDKSEQNLSRLSSSVDLLEMLVCYEPLIHVTSVHIGRQTVFQNFVLFFLEELEKRPDLIDSDYFNSGLSFITPILSQTPPNVLPEVRPFFPELVADHELKSRIANAILRLEPKTNVESAISLCRLMYLLGKQDDFKDQVARSISLRHLTKSVGEFLRGNLLDYKNLQDSLILVIRICFESTSTVENIMSKEIVKHMKRGGRRELRQLINDTSYLFGRDPQIYTNIMAKKIRLTDDLANHDAVYLLEQDYETSMDKPTDQDIEMLNVGSSKALESSTGLVHLILHELMETYKSDWTSSPELDPETKEEPKSKKTKSLDFMILLKNPQFAHMCFLLQTLTELLGSSKEAKLEFITFSKKDGKESNKPRTTSLNFFIHQMISSQLFVVSSGPEFERRDLISSLAKLTILALVSTTAVESVDDVNPKEDPDMTIVRKFLMDVISRILKELCQPGSFPLLTYSKLYDLLDLCGCLLSSKFREVCYPLLDKNATKMDPYFIASAFIEIQLPNLITSALARLDLNFPSIGRIIKVGLKPLANLAKIKVANAELFESNTIEDEEIEDDIEDKDETPDLFRNSTLGMYDIDLDSDDENDYYDDGPMDVMMSESDSSDGDSDSTGITSDSDEDSVEDENMMEEELQNHLEGYDSEDSANDIEIIDELAIQSETDSEYDEDEGDLSDFYGFDDEADNISDEYGGSGEDIEEDEDEEIEFEDDELDEWLDAFADEDDIEGENQESGSRYAHATINDRGFDDRQLHFDDDDSFSDNESGTEIDGAATDLDEGNDDTARARSFVTSFFDSHRPVADNVSNLLEDLLQGRHLQIDIGSNGNDGLFFLNDRSALTPRNSFDTFIHSTTERWKTAYSFFYRSIERMNLEKVYYKVHEAIFADSMAIFHKKQEARERLRKEKEEKERERKEALKRRREEEARQRELDSVANPREPVMLMIGDREVDISGTDIDPEFFEALPEDMREEVFTEHVRERRSQASNMDAEVREIDPDFLDALPDHIREEIMQQESFSQRFSGSGFRYEDEDEVDESGEESDGGIAQSSELVEGNHEIREEKKTKLRSFTSPIIDRTGVASLIRLLFAPQPINQREHIYLTLLQMCNNKQTRADIMSLLIAVLYDGLGGQKSLERVFDQIASKSEHQKSHHSSFPIGATPVVVGVQMIEAVFYLLEKNNALRLFLLTEHENIFISKKHQRKNKLKDPSACEERYPINLLFKLLENPLLREENFFIDLLASVLHFGTRPLLILGDESKSHPASFDTNFIPDKNLRLIVRILTSNECVNTTFRRTISGMQHLSLLKNAQKVFSAELSENAMNLGRCIISDLKSLTNSLAEKSEYDTNGKLLSSFTAPSSAQAKLLRILTALDYMFETKTKPTGDKSQEVDRLTLIYQQLELGTLWDALSDCLRVLEENQNLTKIVTVLLPLIEALMVVCKHSKVKEIHIKDVMKYEAKKIDFTKEPIESLFFSFTDEHKKILNQMVRTNPNLMSGPFSMLVRNPKVLEFDNKKNYFDRQLHEVTNPNDKLSISIRRDQVFLDSYRALFFKSVDTFRNSLLEINFKGEAGVDAGGVTREWYQVLSRQMFNPDYALFTAVASDETTFHPNRTSFINPEHLSFFKFIGRIIGKAIFDNCFLDCHFSRAVYKKILDRPVSLKDMENLDLEYFKSLMWMLENDITDIITEDFSVETDDYGEHKTIDLIPNGRNIPVTESNKQEYVRLVVEYRLQTSVSEQMSNFITGFHEIIPKDLVAIFDEQELELLISGLPDIEVQDWQNNTTYINYSASSEQIQWFWRAVKSFDNEERAKLLQFATGTSKVPLNGFKELRGANGGCKFSIHRDYGPTDRLPSSHTCFNQIDLPAYETYETLRGSLLLAITEGHEGFGLA